LNDSPICPIALANRPNDSQCRLPKCAVYHKMTRNCNCARFQELLFASNRTQRENVTRLNVRRETAGDHCPRTIVGEQLFWQDVTYFLSLFCFVIIFYRSRGSFLFCCTVHGLCSL